jgi:hypothetical protein
MIAHQEHFVGAMLSAMRVSETHLASEYLDDLEATLDSVTEMPTYVFMPEPGRVTVLTDRAAVRKFYVDSRQAFRPQASRILTHLAGDWYEFQENMPTREIIGPGRLATLNTVNIFPRAGDGIQGEFLWERYGVDDEVGVPEVPAHLGPKGSLPVDRLRNAKIHEEFVKLVAADETDAAVRALRHDCIWAGRSYLANAVACPIVKAQGREAVRLALEAWKQHYSIDQVSVLTRFATDWYVFAEELYTVRILGGLQAGETREFRKACVYVISGGGLIQGEMWYGTDLTIPTAGRRPSVGRISWCRSGFTDDLCMPSSH